MQPQPRAYLASLRRELLQLAAALDPDTAAGLGNCVEEIVAKSLAREEHGAALVADLEAAIRAAASAAGVALPAFAEASPSERRSRMLCELEKAWSLLPPGSPQRRELEVAASRADGAFIRRFTEHAAGIRQELAAAPVKQGWKLSAERIEQALPGLFPRWRGARVDSVRGLPGMHAKEVYFVDLRLASGEAEALVMRCDRDIDLTHNSVVNEYPLLCALHARGFELPEPLALIADADVLGQPALLMRRVGGREKTVDELRHPERAFADAARFLARLHATPVAGLSLADDSLADGVAAMWRRRIAAVFDWWRGDAIEPMPAMWRARRWLEDNVHLVADRATVTHGDFNLRNILFDEDDRLSSVLDWELAYIGHPAGDLGYIRSNVEALMPWDKFDAMYREAGGVEVTREQVAYFDIWGLYRNLAINATNQKLFLNGETTDIFLGASAIVYVPLLLGELIKALEHAD